MHIGKRRHAQLVIAIACAGWLTGVTPALAYHTSEERLTDGTAYTLRKRTIKIGLWTAEYGILDNVDVGTYILPWLLRVASLIGKVELRLSPELSVGPRLAIFHLNSDNLKKVEDADFRVTAIPFELNGSYRFDDTWTASLQGVYTYVRLRGTFDQGALEGAAAVSNLQFVGTGELRLSRVTALYLRGRWVAHQWQPSGSATYVLHPDEFTTVEIQGRASVKALDVQNAFSVVPGVAFSWDTFNLRVGLGYGNFNLGGVNFVFPRKSLVADLDVFWRW